MKFIEQVYRGFYNLGTFRKRRDRAHIIAGILTIAKDGSPKTRIMYRGNLSFTQLNEYLPFLLKMKLLKVDTQNGRKIYKTTAKGVKYLKNLEKISNLLRQGEGNQLKPTHRRFG